MISCCFFISIGVSRAVPIDAPKVKLQAPLFDNLGTFHHPISTKDPLAQRFFDQGLLLFYAFDYGESIRSFREAIRLDPSCAMCHWGLALALSSKTNTPLNGHENQEAFNAIKKAQQIVDPKNPIEKAYINALAKRVTSKSVSSKKMTGSCCMVGDKLPGSQEALNYAKAMHKVMQQFPNDLDAKNLYVFAIFDVNNWDFFSTDGKPKPNTLAIIKVLKEVLRVDPKNIAANHYYIHVLEQSSHPEQALSSANFLRDAVPGAEHLLHMPAHIYFNLGRYQDAIIANQKAIAAIKKYQTNTLTQGFKPEINYLYLHNLQFLWAAASMSGQSALAQKTARELVRETPAAWLKQENYLQSSLPYPYYSEVRFGKWPEILNEAKPADTFQYTIGMWHYARGLANIKLNHIKAAENDLQKLRAIVKQGPIDKNLGSFGLDQLNIALHILEAAFAEKKENNRAMLEHLKKAVQIEDNIGYREPPAWYFPTREALGYALLKKGRFAEAAIAFELDLKKYPNNGWALFGLAKTMQQLGRKAEANRLEKAFKASWQHADIATPPSLF